MPSLANEQLIDLFRKAPETFVELARSAIDLPPFDRIEVAPGDLSPLIPASHRADVLLLVADNKPVFAIIGNVQLDSDPDKLPIWPLAQAAAHHRYQCPACLIVYTPYPSIAAWASQRRHTGQPGDGFAPFVCGPSAIPKIKDPRAAAEHPNLAVLSALAHAHDPDALDIAKAAVLGLTTAPEDERVLWHSAILTALHQPARIALENWMNASTFPIEETYHYKKGQAHGEAIGAARALLTFLQARGFAVPNATRTRILACADPTQLTTWVTRAATATSLDEVFAVP